ncbi:radical SAM protein [Elusimicrobiota bacterium]
MTISVTKKIYIEHMGCVRRALDATKFKNYFLSNNCMIVNKPQKADYLLFITCAYRKINENHALKRIQELKEYEGELFVGGCLPGIDGKQLYQNFKGISFSASDNEYIDNIFPDFKIKFIDLPDANLLYPRSILQIIRQYLFTFRPDLSYFKKVKDYLEKRIFLKYYYLRIAWGCIDQHCSYCVIWRGIGRLRSKPAAVCLKEFKEAIKQGYKKFIIVADNPGAYGLDINTTFTDILKKLLEVNGNNKLAIEGLHPFWLIKYADELIPLFQSGKICSLLSPAQSGNNRILTLMNRRHNIEQFKEILLKIRKASPKLKFHTHIMVGFPSETEEEFKETLQLVKELKTDLVEIFGYCDSPGIADPGLLKQRLSEELIKERTKTAIKFMVKNKIPCATE